MKALTIISACALSALLLTAAPLPSGVSNWLSSQAFAEEPVIRRGTPFRGIALGDTQSEVEAALSLIGMRCLTPREVTRVRDNTYTLIEDILGKEACRIVPEGTDLLRDNIAFQHYAIQAFRELKGLSPIDGVIFDGGRAVMAAYSASFFGAKGMPPRTFAQSIIENYGFPDGLDGMNGGWRGFTDEGERATIVYSPDHTLVVLVVEWPSASTAPSFN